MTELPRGTETTAPGSGRISAVAFLVVSSGKVLLELCPKKRAQYGGPWFVPGGKIEPGEGPETALHREVAEELGIEIIRAVPLPLLQADPEPATAEEPTFVRPYLLRETRGALPRQTLDHGNPLRWEPIGSALASPVAIVRMMVASVLR